MKNLFTIVSVTLLVTVGFNALMSPIAWAQEVENVTNTPAPQMVPGQPVTGTKMKGRKTTINFEDELIEGEVKKPELLYLLQKKQFNFKRLIKLRENFLPEMRRTAEDLK